MAGREMAGGGVAATQAWLDDGQTADVERAFTDLRDYVQRQASRLADLYARGSASLIDSVTDPRVLALYALKGIRLVSAYGALRIASNTFQRMYDQRGYGVTGGKPPSLLLFVLLFLAVDLAFLLATGVVLMLVTRLFRGQEGFPIDGELLGAWALDAACSTAIVGAV